MQGGWGVWSLQLLLPQTGGMVWLALGLALQALPSMTLRVPGESRKHLRSRHRGRKAPQPYACRHRNPKP